MSKDSIVDKAKTRYNEDVHQSQNVKKKQRQLQTAFIEGYSLAASELEAAKKEIAELKAWKQSAMSVMPPMQEIGKALGVKLGDSIHDKILPGIERLKNSPAARYREAIHRLYPFCHEDHMKGESGFERAWLNAESVLLSDEWEQKGDEQNAILFAQFCSKKNIYPNEYSYKFYKQKT